jgi:hypothetical protein
MTTMMPFIALALLIGALALLGLFAIAAWIVMTSPKETA